MHRVGIVGANLYGRIYTGAFSQQPDTEVVGMAFSHGDYEDELPAQLGLAPYENLGQMMDDTVPNIVCICSGTADHAEHALSAMAAGAHVLCDRPIAGSLEEGQQMIDSASRAGVKLMVGHVLRFWPEYVAAEQFLRSGELGRIRSVTTSRVSGTLTTEWHERLVDANLGLGALEALIHDLDFLGWISGSPEAVLAQGLKDESGAWGEMHALLRFSDGVQAQCEASYLVPLSFPLAMYLRILAEKGTLVFEFQGALSERGTSTRRLVLTRAGTLPEVIEVPGEDAYANEVAHFLECVEKDRDVRLGTGEQALQALAVALAIKEAATDNQGMEVPGF
jgi:predicted dehydrogenase